MNGEDATRRVDELRASRGRISAAVDADRLRLERQLHDGVQQRLMVIQIKLALLRERIADAGLGAELDEIAADAEVAVDELRALAHGIYPTVLRERGLGDALRALARSCPLAVEVADAGVGRAAPVVETAIYLSVSDAIENAVRHAGAGARVRVELGRRGDDVAFEVVDDGAGFDPAGIPSGGGLVAMRDRLGAVDGSVEIKSTPGGGTAVRGRAPASGPAFADG